MLGWWVLQRVLAREPLGADVLVAALACYLPAAGMGMTWFVTVAVQLVLLDPWLRRAARAAGAAASTIAALGLLVAFHAWALEILAFVEPRLPLATYVEPLWAFWILVPPYFLLLLAGHAVATRRLHRDPRVVSVAALAWAAAAIVAEGAPPASAAARIAAALGDAPLAVLVLAFSSRLARLPGVGAALAWAGANSWEAYLGQTVTYALAGSAFLRVADADGARFAWTLVLAAGGLAYAALWQALLRRGGRAGA